MQWAYPLALRADGPRGRADRTGAAGRSRCRPRVFGAAKALKAWAISSLGARWTFRVLVPPGAPLVDRRSVPRAAPSQLRRGVRRDRRRRAHRVGADHRRARRCSASAGCCGSGSRSRTARWGVDDRPTRRGPALERRAGADRAVVVSGRRRRRGAVLVLVGLSAVITGGFRTEIAGVRVSVTSWWRPVLVALLVGLGRHAAAARPRCRSGSGRAWSAGGATR